MADHDTPVPIGEILQPVEKVIGVPPDADRARDVAERALAHEVGALSDDRKAVIEELLAGRLTSDEADAELAIVTQALHGAQDDLAETQRGGSS